MTVTLFNHWRRVIRARRALLIGCTILVTVPALPVTAAQQKSPSPLALSSTTVIGVAGKSTTMQLTSRAQLGNGGADVEFTGPSTASALGLLLIRSDRHGHFQPNDIYLEFYGTDYGMCGLSHCPGLDAKFYPRAGVFQYDSSPAVTLPPGTYTAVLLGPADVRMSARIRFRNEPTGAITLQARDAKYGRPVTLSPVVSTHGQQTVTDQWMAESRNLFFAGTLFMVAAQSPGMVHGDGTMSVNYWQPSSPPPPSPAACQAEAQLNWYWPGPPQVLLPRFERPYYYSAEPWVFQGGPVGSQAAPADWGCVSYDMTAASAGIHHVSVAKFVIELPSRGPTGT